MSSQQRFALIVIKFQVCSGHCTSHWQIHGYLLSLASWSLQYSNKNIKYIITHIIIPIVRTVIAMKTFQVVSILGKSGSRNWRQTYWGDLMNTEPTLVTFYMDSETRKSQLCSPTPLTSRFKVVCVALSRLCRRKVVLWLRTISAIRLPGFKLKLYYWPALGQWIVSTPVCD